MGRAREIWHCWYHCIWLGGLLGVLNTLGTLALVMDDFKDICKFA